MHYIIQEKNKSKDSSQTGNIGVLSSTSALILSFVNLVLWCTVLTYCVIKFGNIEQKITDVNTKLLVSASEQPTEHQRVARQAETPADSQLELQVVKEELEELKNVLEDFNKFWNAMVLKVIFC